MTPAPDGLADDAIGLANMMESMKARSALFIVDQIPAEPSLERITAPEGARFRRLPSTVLARAFALSGMLGLDIFQQAFVIAQYHAASFALYPCSPTAS